MPVLFQIDLKLAKFTLVAQQAPVPVIVASNSQQKPRKSKELDTRILACDASGIARAAELLKSGSLVAIPTETVYGLAADARSDQAVHKIYDAKKRPSANPLILHLASISDLSKYAVASERAMALARRFWPGPLTMVLPAKKNSGISRLATAGHPTVALRVPDHGAAREILAEFGGPAAAPSANISGRVSPTESSHVLEDLRGRIDAVVDGGSCAAGIESTILAIAGDSIRMLRPGAIAAEEIESAIDGEIQLCPDSGAPPSPGRGFAHYAPESRVRINVERPRSGELWLGFGPRAEGALMNLSETGSLKEAASNLFKMMRTIDNAAIACGASAIAVSRIPESGLGRAINDRLKRAADGRQT